MPGTVGKDSSVLIAGNGFGFVSAILEHNTQLQALKFL